MFSSDGTTIGERIATDIDRRITRTTRKINRTITLAPQREAIAERIGAVRDFDPAQTYGREKRSLNRKIRRHIDGLIPEGRQWADIDPDHEGVHVIGSGGAPQTELADPDACRHGGLIPLTLHRGRQGSCPNCRCWFKVRGGRLAGHEPGPPTIDQCPYCGRPYPELRKGQKSYTDPPCRECAAAHDERDISAGSSSAGAPAVAERIRALA